MKTFQFSFILIALLIIGLDANSQGFDQSQLEFIKGKVKGIVKDYGDNADLLGDINEHELDREEYKVTMTALFANKNTYVYNDLDPEHKTSEMLTISTYLEYLMLWYSDAGIKTTIDTDDLYFGGIIKKDEQTFYMNVMAEKGIKGLYMGKKPNMIKKKLSFSIAFDKTLESFKIVQISTYGLLTIFTTPQADIYVDGILYGSGKALDGFGKGIHKVEIKKESYYTQNKDIYVDEDKEQEELFELKAITSSLIVESEPEGAEIFIDAKSYGISPKTIRGLIVGEHKIELRKENHPTVWQMFEIKENEDTKMSLKLNFQQVAINSTPQGATFFIDNKEMGVTPKIVPVILGTNNIKLVKDDYITADGKFTTQFNHLHYGFELIPAKVEIQYNKAKKQRYYWLGAATISLLGGTYYYLSANSNYNKYKTATDDATDLRDKVERADKIFPIALGTGVAFLLPPLVIQIKQKKLKTKWNYNPKPDFELKPRTGTLTVASDPDEAEVVIDGLLYGKTPLTLNDFIIGEHKLELQKANYPSIKKTFTLAENQSIEFNEKLISESKKQMQDIAINTTPQGAKLYIDGKYMGITPKEISISVGQHKIKLEKQEFKTIETSFDVLLKKVFYEFYLTK